MNKRINYCSEEKDYIAAMDKLHFRPEEKEAITSQVIFAIEKMPKYCQADKETEIMSQDTHEG